MQHQILHGDCLQLLDTITDNSVHCCITSPPYYRLRNYDATKQLGQESTPTEYIENLVKIFNGIKRVLRDDGTAWLNLGDTYRTTQLKLNDPKIKLRDMLGIPWSVALALRDDGWYLRQDIIWHKTNCLPESVRTRCVRSHEYIFLLSKQTKYYFDYQSIKEPAKDLSLYSRIGHRIMRAQTDKAKKRAHGKTSAFYGNKLLNELANKRSIWSVATGCPNSSEHYAVFPEQLVVPCVLAGCPTNGTVLDPFCGTATVGVVCEKLNRNFIGIDINDQYVEYSKTRLNETKKQRKLELAD